MNDHVVKCVFCKAELPETTGHRYAWWHLVCDKPACVEKRHERADREQQERERLAEEARLRE